MFISPDCASFEIKLHRRWDCIVCKSSDGKRVETRGSPCRLPAKQVDGRWTLVVSNPSFCLLGLQDLEQLQGDSFWQMSTFYGYYSQIAPRDRLVHPCVMSFVPWIYSFIHTVFISTTCASRWDVPRASFFLCLAESCKHSTANVGCNVKATMKCC